MTDPELVERLKSALAHIKRGRDMVPDEDEGLAAEVFARAVNHADRDIRAALDATSALLASREAAAAERMRAEIVAWLSNGHGLFARKLAIAIESGSFRTGEG